MDVRAFDQLAALTTAGELELSNTSDSTDGVKAAAFAGPSSQGDRVLAMQMPGTEKTNMQPITPVGTPGRTYAVPHAHRSASPNRNILEQHNAAMKSRDASPANSIARSPCLSPAAEQAMERPSRRGSSVGQRRRGDEVPVIDTQALRQPLPIQASAPPQRRAVDLPPSYALVEQRAKRTPSADGSSPARREPLACVAQEAILAQATRGRKDSVAANSRGGSPAPSGVFVIQDSSDGASRNSAQSSHNTPNSRPETLTMVYGPGPTAYVVDTEVASGRPPTPPPPHEKRSTSPAEEYVFSEDLVIPNFVEIAVPDYLMASTNLNMVHHTFAEVNKVYDAFACRYSTTRFSTVLSNWHIALGFLFFSIQRVILQ